MSQPKDVCVGACFSLGWGLQDWETHLCDLLGQLIPVILDGREVLYKIGHQHWVILYLELLIRKGATVSSGTYRVKSHSEN